MNTHTGGCLPGRCR